MGANRHENLDERATCVREKIRKFGLQEFGLSAFLQRVDRALSRSTLEGREWELSRIEQDIDRF